MRLLGIFALSFIEPGLVGQVFLAESVGDQFTDILEGFLCQIDRIGAHVANQSDTFPA